jgi:hypothetical protein
MAKVVILEVCWRKISIKSKYLNIFKEKNNMKKVLSLVAIALATSFVACGPSADEKAAEAQRKADSARVDVLIAEQHSTLEIQRQVDCDGPEWNKVVQGRGDNTYFFDEYIIDDNLKNGLPDGKYFFLGKSQFGYDDEFEVKDGVIQGLYTSYYKNKNNGKGGRCLRIVANVVDGCYDGYYTFYWISNFPPLPEDPHFLEKGNYKNGKKDGLWIHSWFISDENKDVIGYRLEYIELYRSGEIVDKIRFDKNNLLVDTGVGILMESKEYNEYLNNGN